jgi:hypothetical protein
VITVNHITPKAFQSDLNDLYVCLYDDSSYNAHFQWSADESVFPIDEYGLILVSA